MVGPYLSAQVAVREFLSLTIFVVVDSQFHDIAQGLRVKMEGGGGVQLQQVAMVSFAEYLGQVHCLSSASSIAEVDKRGFMFRGKHFTT